jgi:pyruvate dehydrogenase E2 component (dihydrolipoamide acetyltransferase)
MVARKAEKLGIDLAQVTGSGPQGLITRDDLLAAAAGRGSLAPAEGRTAAGARGAASGAGAVGRGSGVASGAGAAGRGSGVAGGVSTETLPLSDHQVTVAKLMAESRREIPDYTVRVEVDMTRVLLHRGRRSRSDGSRVSMYSYFCYAVSRALERFPRLNGYFHNDALVRYREIGIAVGVAVDEELYAPVVRSPERLAIEQIDSQVADVVSRAKRGALQAEDFLTATFTISNLGGLPVDEFTAVITPGQAGVLAVGRAGKRLMVAADDSIRLRTVCTLNGSFDHRVVNGAQAGAFMAEVKRILEEEIE